MQYRILVGGISPEGEQILNQYLKASQLDYVIEPLAQVGIRGKLKNHGKRAEVALIILDETLYQCCVGTVDDVLRDPKVHKYTTDDNLRQFLISKFGPLDTQVEDNSHKSSKVEDFGMMPQPSEESKVDKDAEIISLNSTIEDLKVQLSQQKLLVDNLSKQIEDAHEGNDDISVFIARIKELEDELESKSKALVSSSSVNYEDIGKITWAENIIKEYEQLKSDIQSERESKSSLEFEKSKLSKEIDDLKEQLFEANKELEDIPRLKSDIDDLNKKLSDKDDEITKKDVEVSGKSSEIGVLQNRIDSLETENTDLKKVSSKYDQLLLKVTNLEVDLKEKEESLKTATNNLEIANANISSLEEQLRSKSSELTELNSSSSASSKAISELQGKVNTLTNDIIDLRKQLSEKNDTISEKDKCIEELNSTLSAKEEELKSEKSSHVADVERLRGSLEGIGNKDAEILSLHEEADKYKEKIDSLISEVETLRETSKNGDELANKLKQAEVQVETYKNSLAELKNQLSEKDKEISSLQEAKLLADAKADGNTFAIDRLIGEKESLSNKILDCEKELSEAKASIASLTSQISGKDAIISSLESDKTKLSNTISSLNEQIAAEKTGSEELSKVKADLLTEQRKVAKLSSELDVLKKLDNSQEVTDLKIELTRVKSELDIARASAGSGEELEKLKEDYKNLKERHTDIELELSEKTELLQEYSSGVFSQLINYSMPKSAMKALATQPKGLGTNFCCIASGSSESINSTYQLLRRTCLTNSKKRYLIIDLVTDSYIDREFGVQRVSTPIDWLNGAKDFKEFLSDTRLPNVKILSTGLAYLNDLYLLQVDWDARLKEVQNYCDEVVILIGSITGVVTKVLLNTFNHCMKTFVVTKATPINLRTVILNLTGFTDLNVNNLTVSCVDFETSASAMYKMLSGKNYKTQIYRDTDVLDI